MQEKEYFQNDEIDLKELFKTIWNKKYFIIILTGIITIFSIVFVLFKTPIYGAKALVEIGNYKLYTNKPNELLDNANSLVKRLNMLFIDKFENEKARVSKIVAISVPKKQENFIEIKAEAISNDLVSKEINKVIEFIQKQHQKILDDFKQRKELEIKNIDLRIDMINNKQIKILEKRIFLGKQNLEEYNLELKRIEENIKKIEDTNPTLTALKLMEKKDLLKYISEFNLQLINLESKKYDLETTIISGLKEKRILLESVLLPFNYKNSDVIGNIMLSENPIKPKKKLIVVVAFITGFILSIFIVFIMQFIKGLKDEER